MCLLIAQEAGVKFESGMLANFWNHNRDGAGVMYFENGAIVVKKILSPTVEQWIVFYNEHAAGRKCFIHLRWRTHGDINESQTHPYPLADGGWLMHNGVLRFGNLADTSKSDTWHYIDRYINTALATQPDYFAKDGAMSRIGSHIGFGNKFAVLTKDGKMLIANKRSGIMWNRCWFSNTYAWDVPASATKVWIEREPMPTTRQEEKARSKRKAKSSGKQGQLALVHSAPKEKKVIQGAISQRYYTLEEWNARTKPMN